MPSGLFADLAEIWRSHGINRAIRMHDVFDVFWGWAFGHVLSLFTLHWHLALGNLRHWDGKSRWGTSRFHSMLAICFLGGYHAFVGTKRDILGLSKACLNRWKTGCLIHRFLGDVVDVLCRRLWLYIPDAPCCWNIYRIIYSKNDPVM